MQRAWMKKRIKLFCSLLSLTLAGVVFEAYFGVPGSLTLQEGERLQIARHPLLISMQASEGGVLNEDGTVGTDDYRGTECTAELKLFGLIPIRTIDVDVTPNREVVPCGKSIGIKIITDGMLVVGVDEIKSKDGRMVFPAKEYDIREGDIIMAVNGQPLESTEQFGSLISGLTDGEVTLEYKRGGQTAEKKVHAVPVEDGGYKLGVWVRDSTAGIGTMTFLDAQTGQYGALGHPVTDGDIGSMLRISEGEILGADIFSVQKGQKGTPGELKGVFKDMNKKLGSIEKNTEQGIYGTVEQGNLSIQASSLPAAPRSRIREGKASILSNISGEEIREYEIEIQKIMYYNNGSNKDMVLHVTDPELLEQTGGIVQGMSGSPILQDGAVVGAVTHVFINDPTRGYGIFIENMLQNIA